MLFYLRRWFYYVGIYKLRYHTIPCPSMIYQYENQNNLEKNRTQRTRTSPQTEKMLSSDLTKLLAVMFD